MKKKLIRLTESDLHRIVKESVKRILNETRLDYDVDNFSGKWNKQNDDNYIDPEGYLDNPHDKDEIEMNLFDDNEDYFTNAKKIENDYSWDNFDKKSVAPGISDYYTVAKGAIPREVNQAILRRNKENDWSNSELNNRQRMMKKWIEGKRDTEQIGDAWEDVQYLNQ